MSRLTLILRRSKPLTAIQAFIVAVALVATLVAVSVVARPSKAHATGFCRTGEQTSVAAGTIGSGYTVTQAPSRLAVFDTSIVKIAPPAVFPGLTIVHVEPTAGHVITDYKAKAIATVTTGDRLGPWDSLDLFLAFDNLGQFPYRITVCLS